MSVSRSRRSPPSILIPVSATQDAGRMGKSLSGSTEDKCGSTDSTAGIDRSHSAEVRSVFHAANGELPSPKPRGGVEEGMDGAVSGYGPRGTGYFGEMADALDRRDHSVSPTAILLTSHRADIGLSPFLPEGGPPLTDALPPPPTDSPVPQIPSTAVAYEIPAAPQRVRVKRDLFGIALLRAAAASPLRPLSSVLGVVRDRPAATDEARGSALADGEHPSFCERSGQNKARRT